MPLKKFILVDEDGDHTYHSSQNPLDATWNDINQAIKEAKDLIESEEESGPLYVAQIIKEIKTTSIEVSDYLPALKKRVTKSRSRS